MKFQFIGTHLLNLKPQERIKEIYFRLTLGVTSTRLLSSGVR